MKIRSLFAALTALVLSVAVFADATYPFTNPTYTPNAILASTTLSASGTVPITLNGVTSLVVRVAGTNTGVTATMQVSETRTSPTWTNVSCQQVGGAVLATITGNGLYRCDVAGFGMAQLNLSAISTGSIAVTMSGELGAGTATAPVKRATYSAAVAALSPAASATDFLEIIGSSTATIRINRVECNGTATAIGAMQITAVVRSTADTAGTALTAVPHDSSSAAASAAVYKYTANPASTGTLVGTIRADVLQLNQTATATYGARNTVWSFGGDDDNQGIVLRGATQAFALNAGGASFPSGASVNCAVTWTEE